MLKLGVGSSRVKSSQLDHISSQMMSSLNSRNLTNILKLWPRYKEHQPNIYNKSYQHLLISKMSKTNEKRSWMKTRGFAGRKCFYSMLSNSILTGLKKISDALNPCKETARELISAK